jgi:hypothetical protein
VYLSFLDVALNDPAASNNLGNVNVLQHMNYAMKWSPHCRLKEAEEEYLFP